MSIRLDHDMTCPTCKAKQDSLSSIGEYEGDEESSGNIAICIQCGAVNVVTETWELRSITKEELKNIQATDLATFNLIIEASVYARHFPRNSN